MEYKIAIKTDVGIKKETNQDSCCVKEARTDRGTILLAVICDGMGGLSKGEVASATLINRFSEWFEKELPEMLAKEDFFEEIKYRWKRIIKEQNTRIAAYGKMLHIQLGSTISAILILEDGRYLIGHVGDSRIYEITDERISRLTEDQTLVAKEVKEGKLTAEEAENDPRRSVLLQCVGASRIVEPTIYEGEILGNACYMLCSDGFRHVITAEEIREKLTPKKNENEMEMESHLAELVDLNMFRHETDNITALLIKTEQEV